MDETYGPDQPAQYDGYWILLPFKIAECRLLKVPGRDHCAVHIHATFGDKATGFVSVEDRVFVLLSGQHRRDNLLVLVGLALIYSITKISQSNRHICKHVGIKHNAVQYNET